MGLKKLYKVFASVALTSLLLGTAEAAPDPNFHIYIAYGQSNMAGAAKDFTDLDKKEHPRFKMFATTSCTNLGRPTVGEIYPAKPPMFHCGEGLSVADWFGRNMADSLPDVTIGIIPVAVGGTSIKLFEPNEYKSYLASAENWLVNWAKDYGPDGDAMARIIEMAKKAQEVGVIKGIIFHQGETDGGLRDWETRVKGTYENILNQLGLKAEDIPFVAGEMVAGGACDGFRSRVRGLSNYIANFGVAKSDNLPGASDRLHFTVEGYRGMGERYAQEMLKLIKLEPAVIIPREPFEGKPAEIPGKIEAENFDIPGTGSANKTFNDLDSENHGESNYRKDLGVDIYEKATGQIVGYNQKGEWLEYTVNVKESGPYTLFAAVAAENDGGSFQLSLDGKNITEEIAVPGIGNYDDYEKVSADINLTSGEHILRFTVTGDWFDVDYFNFVAGENAKDPEIIEPEEPTPPKDTTDIDNTKIALNHLHFNSRTTSFDIFDMQGHKCGNFNAKNLKEATQLLNSTKQIPQGIYLIKNNKFSKIVHKAEKHY